MEIWIRVPSNMISEILLAHFECLSKVHGGVQRVKCNQQVRYDEPIFDATFKLPGAEMEVSLFKD